MRSSSIGTHVEEETAEAKVVGVTPLLPAAVTVTRRRPNFDWFRVREERRLRRVARGWALLAGVVAWFLRLAGVGGAISFATSLVTLLLSFLGQRDPGARLWLVEFACGALGLSIALGFGWLCTLMATAGLRDRSSSLADRADQLWEEHLRLNGGGKAKRRDGGRGAFGRRP